MSTDPSSSDFDPLLAIYSETSEPSSSEGVTVYDNIAVFEGSLRKQELGVSEEPGPSQKSSSKSFSAKKRVQEEARNRDVSKLKELMEMRRKMDMGDDPDAEEKVKKKVKPKKAKTKKNLLTSMESLSKGPYSILHRIVKHHIRCNVYVRDFCGLRGVCTGYVVAYDRYMNLAMIDIDETFRKPPTGKVVDHQKPLSVAMLEEAMSSLNLGKSQEKQIPQKAHMEHRSTTGVQILTKHTRSHTRQSESFKEKDIKVKTVGKEVFKSEVFHGGTPKLYHRHLDQLLLMGDSIVLVSTKK